MKRKALNPMASQKSKTDRVLSYYRIILRISQSPPLIRRKAQMILAWIGCSPAPMSRYEMEQALLVDSGGKAAPSVVGQVNFVRLCGPIVELVDDKPQFVHFTVKEYVQDAPPILGAVSGANSMVRYIFSQQVKDFMSKAEASYSLGKVLLIYLLSGAFHEELQDGRLQENILAGRYRLHWFATTHWVTLIRRCVEQSRDLSAHPDMLQLLEQLGLELGNQRFDGQVNLCEPVFTTIEADNPGISQLIRGILQLRQNEGWTDWVYTDGEFFFFCDLGGRA